MQQEFGTNFYEVIHAGVASNFNLVECPYHQTEKIPLGRIIVGTRAGRFSFMVDYKSNVFA